MKYRTLFPLYSSFFFVLVWLVFFYKGTWSQLFSTPDQQGYRYYKEKEYDKASKSFENPSFRAASYFKDGEFKKAKAIYMTRSSKESKYNLGNAEMMLGKYDKAIESYEIALKIDPYFLLAKENMSLAMARKKMNEVENDGKQGIGDMYDMQPDEIVYDNNENKGEDDDRSGQKEIKGNNTQWLDRIQTSPKVFLKNKFSYQYQIKDFKREAKDDK